MLNENDDWDDKTEPCIYPAFRPTEPPVPHDDANPHTDRPSAPATVPAPPPDIFDDEEVYLFV
jgi:hypothetical protein